MMKPLLLSPTLFAGSAAFLPDGKRVARQGDQADVKQGSLKPLSASAPAEGK